MGKHNYNKDFKKENPTQEVEETVIETETPAMVETVIETETPAMVIQGIFQARVLEWGAIAFSVTNLESILKSRATVLCQQRSV